MKIAFFDTHRYDREAFTQANLAFQYDIDFFDVRLTSQTADIARGFDVICAFVNDKLDEECLKRLNSNGVRLIALRSAGFNHVDVPAADRLGLKVVRVPEYSPHAVAEHAVALLMTLNRKVHRSYSRVRELNFSLEGLVGFDLYSKTVGVIGTGKIGGVFCRILHGFGCRILAMDPKPDQTLEKDLNLKYTDLNEICEKADIISLHAPLVPSTRHLLNDETIGKMKTGVVIINTGRGALIDTRALITGLKRGKIGGAGLDVYEEEENIFFSDLSDQVLQDDVLARLLTFPNVLITSHQAFLTREALRNIATTTLQNIDDFFAQRDLGDRLVSSRN